MCIFEILWLRDSEIAEVVAQSDYLRKVGLNASMTKMKLFFNNETSVCSVLLKVFL